MRASLTVFVFRGWWWGEQPLEDNFDICLGCCSSPYYRTPPTKEEGNECRSADEQQKKKRKSDTKSREPMDPPQNLERKYRKKHTTLCIEYIIWCWCWCSGRPAHKRFSCFIFLFEIKPTSPRKGQRLKRMQNKTRSNCAIQVSRHCGTPSPSPPDHRYRGKGAIVYNSQNFARVQTSSKTASPYLIGRTLTPIRSGGGEAKKIKGSKRKRVKTKSAWLYFGLHQTRGM